MLSWVTSTLDLIQKGALADTLSRLTHLESTELNLTEKEGYEYGYAMFEQLPDVYVDSSKYESALCVDVSNIDDTNDTIMKMECNEDTESQLWLSTEQLTDGQNNDTTSCAIVLKFTTDEKMLPN